MTRTQLSIIERLADDYAPQPAPSHAQVHDVEQVRAMVGVVAVDLVRICPPSRELDHALNRLDEAA